VAFAPSTWARLQPRLDDYARELADARSSVCRQSEIERTLDLATADAAALCLDEHLDGFQTLLEGWQNLGPSDVREALRGASALPPMAMCTDPSHLRHRAAAPDGVTDREQIKALRRRLAASRAAHTTARYDDALSEADAALQGAQTLGWAPLIAEARIVRGGTLEALGRYDEAERELEEAVIVAGGAGQDLLVAKAATALVYVVGEMLARYDDGLRWGRLASMATERLGLEDHVVVATLLNNVGIVQMAKREFDAALASYQESLRLREELLGPDSLETAAALNNVGTAYHARSEYETALTYFERSLEIKEQFLGPDHPEVAGQISNIGNVHAAHGDHVRALEAFRRSLEIRQQALGSEHPSIAPSLGNIARSLELQGNREEARGYYERALKVYEDSLGPRHLDVGRMEHALGTITYDLGQRAESIPHFERALEIREYGGATVRGLAQTRFSLGQAMWEGGGDRKRAHALATQALEEYRSLGEEEQIIAMVVESWLAGHPAP
jgi:tetratricopeptide (TPR) repeat protein